MPGLDLQPGGSAHEGQDARFSVLAGMSAETERDDESDTVRRERESFEAFLGTLTPFQQGFYRAVVESAAFGGHDSTSRPITVAGAPREMAAMVYSMDSGQALGFDAVYVGWNDETGAVVRELVRERDYISHLEARIEGGDLVVTYGTGTRRTMRLPLTGLQTAECENRLKSSDRILSDLHVAIPRAPAREPYSGIMHGMVALSTSEPQAA